MRDAQVQDQTQDQTTEVIDLGAATALTQGTFLPKAFESVIIRDHYDPM
jgi:hypothetical protein